MKGKGKIIGYVSGTTLLSLLSGSASAEVSEFRVGDLLVSIIDIIGFNLVDISGALPELIGLILLLAVVFLVLKRKNII